MAALVALTLVALVAAAVVIVYAAYPYRGQDVPGAPGLGRALRRGVESLPTVAPVEERADEGTERPAREPSRR